MTAATNASESVQTYVDHVNPQWVRLLKLLQMQTEYTVCSGAELHTAQGDVLLDFLSGYCVHNIGHNHPAVIDALHAELDRRSRRRSRQTSLSARRRPARKGLLRLLRQ